MIRVGVTGGIGSGKSVVCKVFKQLGVLVYDADFEAKRILVENQSVISQIKKTFGDDVYLSNNKIDKKKLASLIFTDKKALEKINSIVHPAVFKDFENWSKLQQNQKYVIIESALLFETNYYKQLNKIISVLSPLELRIERILKRDNTTKQDILNRINSQSSDEKKSKQSDFIIKNDDENLLIPQILKIHKQLI